MCWTVANGSSCEVEHGSSHLSDSSARKESSSRGTHNEVLDDGLSAHELLVLPRQHRVLTLKVSHENHEARTPSAILPGASELAIRRKGPGEGTDVEGRESRSVGGEEVVVVLWDGSKAGGRFRSAELERESGGSGEREVLTRKALRDSVDVGHGRQLEEAIGSVSSLVASVELSESKRLTGFARGRRSRLEGKLRLAADVEPVQSLSQGALRPLKRSSISTSIDGRGVHFVPAPFADEQRPQASSAGCARQARLSAGTGHGHTQQAVDLGHLL